MQRLADSGPYKLGNIRKAVAAKNAATRSAVYRNEQAEIARQQREAALDAMMAAPSAPAPDEDEKDDGMTIAEHYEREGRMAALSRYNFVR